MGDVKIKENWGIEETKGNMFTAAVLKSGVRSVIALLAIVWAGAFLWEVTFATAEELSKVAEYVVGFVTGSIVSVVIGFYFGGVHAKEQAGSKKEE